MEIIKKQISLEEITNRKEKKYGMYDSDHIYIKINIEQTIDNLGLFTDFNFIESEEYGEYSYEDLLSNYRPRIGLDKWFKEGDKIISKTNSKLNSLKSYKESDRFKVGLDIEKGSYVNYRGDLVNGVTRLTYKSNYLITYVFDGNEDSLLGTTTQKSGLQYTDTRNDTVVKYNAEGINETNASLSAISKEEYLLGIINKPEIINDVFIDRGGHNIIEKHLRINEIQTINHLENYNNNYFNVIK